MQLVNIGFNNLVNADRVIAVVSPESAPVKRIVQDGKAKGTLIDATHGRKTMSVIITDSDNVILSYLDLNKIAEKFSAEVRDALREQKGLICCFVRTQRLRQGHGFSGH